jgi:hypothetical protein
MRFSNGELSGEHADDRDGSTESVMLLAVE